MSTKFYIKNDNGNILSMDGKTRYTLLEGKAAYDFLKTEDGKRRCFHVEIDENGDKLGIETTPEFIKKYEADERHARYLRQIEVECNITVVSANMLVSVAGEDDIEMQVFRSSGAGGQKVNKTSSAVRLIHKSGIVVSCQTERSQFQNKETCLRMLRSKLVEIREREHLANIADIKGVQQKIEWGSQIRNYVFMPYTLVKDTRTGCETSNVNAVMDGALDPFIESYLNCLATGNWVQK